jgi:hypothetical protein
MMAYEDIPREDGSIIDKRRDDFQRWIYEDCNVVECIEGNIYKLIEGVPALYNCPVCQRTNITPGRRIWRGKITLHTEEDMKKRLNERLDLVRNKHARYARAKELAVMLYDMLKPKPEAHREERVPSVQSVAGRDVGRDVTLQTSREEEREDPF